jgi:hypothetical protein
MAHPYQDAPSKAFWRTAVAEREPTEISELWDPKFRLRRAHQIVTFGSCFAQHIGRALRARKYKWFDAEPAPHLFPADVNAKYGYGVFSARTGNIYTAAALRQWVDWALGAATPPDEVWEKDGRYIDPFRPAIEPEGFATREELLRSRDVTLRAFRDCITKSTRFIFTLGLTEGWIDTARGHCYAVCPGTLAGEFDPSRHAFRNYDYVEIRRDLLAAINAIHAINRQMRFLLTVSPVPLTATASGQHVLTATTYSKSVLRAVAGSLASRPAVDYFPSYEIIAAAPFKGMFYKANRRDVAPDGVAFVMDSFFAGLAKKFPDDFAKDEAAAAAQPAAVSGDARAIEEAADVVCEERMLEAFSNQ